MSNLLNLIKPDKSIWEEFWKCKLSEYQILYNTEGKQITCEAFTDYLLVQEIYGKLDMLPIKYEIMLSIETQLETYKPNAS